jgi:GrpB-like predicted nucleotidyltransferase (UPF0157 family)
MSSFRQNSSMLDEPIHLEGYRLEWAEVFQSEHNRLAESLGIPFVAIEHIGSTAVPGMWAKPIVDIMIGAQPAPPPETWTEILVRLGYEALGEAGVPGRWYFRLRTSPFRNAHIVERGGEHWIQNLAFRDYLRRSPEAARRYESAKRAAVDAGATTLVAYSRAKSSAVESLLWEAIRAGTS